MTTEQRHALEALYFEWARNCGSKWHAPEDSLGVLGRGCIALRELLDADAAARGIAVEDSPSEKLEILAELERLRTRRPSCLTILKDIA